MKDSASFYIGYQPQAPAGLKRTLRTTVVASLCLTAAIAMLLIAGQRPFATSVFQFGQIDSVTGTLREHPYPQLELKSGESAMLVGPGKHGADDFVRGLDGSLVRFKATRIFRQGQQMLEVDPGSLQVMNSGVPATLSSMPEAAVTLVGEIVDSKCYLGVMNPGEGKVHRDCAARCLSGGIPPAFIARDENGQGRLFLLTGPQGQRLRREVLDYVAEPVQITGSLIRSGPVPELRITKMRRSSQ